MTILRPTPQDYDELLAVWEASVRSTHHFLTEENIQFYKHWYETDTSKP
nr:hypothetical protein [Bacteroides clarus]